MAHSNATCSYRGGVKKALLCKSKKPTIVLDKDWEDLDDNKIEVPSKWVHLKGSMRDHLWEDAGQKLESLHMPKLVWISTIHLEPLFTMRMEEDASTQIFSWQVQYYSHPMDIEHLDIEVHDEDKNIRLPSLYIQYWNYASNNVTQIFCRC